MISFRTMLLGSLALTLSPAAALAQTAPAAPAAAPAPDPARLAASRAVIDLILPPAERDKMVETMLKPIMAEMRQTFSQLPFYQEGIASKPDVAAKFNRFLDARQEKMFAALRAGLPGMSVAMSRAYARRFDLKQLADIRAFFETPSGRDYAAASFTLMSDPDVIAWQRELMTSQMADMQQDMAKFLSEISASESPKADE